jgi:hypothetical protein
MELHHFQEENLLVFLTEESTSSVILDDLCVVARRLRSRKIQIGVGFLLFMTLQSIENGFALHLLAHAWALGAMSNK